MLDSLLRPQVVAVLFIPRAERSPGRTLVENLVAGGFGGTVLPIGEAGEVAGLPCLSALSEYRGSLDLALIAVPVEQLPDAVDAALDARARTLAICTALPSSAEHSAWLSSVVVRCRERGARLLGPGALGVINTAHHLNASLLRGLPRAGGISILSQSNAVGAALLDAVSGSSQGIATMVCLGDRTDITESELLLFLAADPQTRVVACYLENIDAGERFVKSCEAVTQDKPLVILKSGVTALGAATARLELGRAAGADIAYAAAFKRAGVVRAERFEELIDFCASLSTQPLPRGDRIGLITNAGGAAVMAADAIAESGSMLSLSSALEHNPVDLHSAASPESYGAAVSMMLQSPDVDALVVILAPGTEARPCDTACAVIAAASHGGKPVTAAFLGGAAVEVARQELRDAGIPAFCGPERAVKALRALSEHAAWKRRPPRVVTRFPINRRRVERILLRHQRTGHFEIGELQAKEILSAYGFSVPLGQVASTADEAVAVAERLGYPVALKVISPDIVRKTDFGGYKLHLTTPDDVRDAFDLMVLRILHKAPGAHLEGVYVEKMCHGSQEVIVGMQHDPHFGPMMMFGVGGIYVETMEDVAFHLAPITASEAVQMLKATRSFSVLSGRGGPGINIEAIAEALQRVSQLATDFPQIVSIDINPLIVGPSPQPAIAVDAEILLARQEKP